MSRLVPRKGMDVLIRAAARLRTHHPRLEVVIGGSGRDRRRLARLVASLDAPVRLLGRVDDADLPMLYATGSGADIQKPLAVVVMGGLVTSTLLTLLVLIGLIGSALAIRAATALWDPLPILPDDRAQLPALLPRGLPFVLGQVATWGTGVLLLGLWAVVLALTATRI